jgi:hypothetical protein
MPLMTDEHVRAELAHENDVILLDEVTWCLFEPGMRSISPATARPFPAPIALTGTIVDVTPDLPRQAYPSALVGLWRDASRQKWRNG